MDFYKNLNNQQLKAVKHIEGPCLVLAGAGSGKTRVLTTRIAHLIDNGINDYNILAITFTNKAAKEMRERLDILVPGNASFVGTFHSLGLRIIRENCDKVGLSNNFTILDSDDVNSVIKKILKDKHYDPKQYAPSYIRNRISFIKNENLSDAEITRFFNTPPEKIALEVYESYRNMLIKNNSVDFDDLLLLPVKLFTNYPDVLEHYQNRFKYILIDEYQDTNEVQYKFSKLLSSKYRNIFCVGDPDQCLIAGTIVETENGPKKIEEINSNDKVLSAIGFGKYAFKKIEKIIKKEYKGEVIKVELESGKTFISTPNHVAFSKITIDVGKYYVYLMYRSDKGFRIGMASSNRIIDGKVVNGICARLNGDACDRAWIIKVCANKEEAVYYEEYYASFYGIPKLVFHNKGRGLSLNQDFINQLFSSVDTKTRAIKLMEDEGLYFNFPHYTAQSLTNLTAHNRERKNLILTFLGGKYNKADNRYTNRISLNSCNLEDKSSLLSLGFNARDSKGKSWRIETERSHYEDLEAFAEKLDKSTNGYDIFRRIKLTNNTFDFLPVSSLREGLWMVSFDNNELVEDKIKKISKMSYDGYVYDLNIAETRNYFCNGICCHNSIYKFRGANYKNILNFEQDYKDAEIIPLEENYRSTKMILDTANSVIKNNKERKEKNLWSSLGNGAKTKYLRSYDEKNEITLVISEIKNLLNEGFRKSDMAILYRTNAQSRIVEEMLLKSNIPYKVVGSYYFYNRKEIKDLLSYLRLVVNIHDEISLRRVINVPKRGIGEATIKALESIALSDGVTLFDAINKGKELEFKKLILEIVKESENLSLTELIDLILDKTGIVRELETEHTLESDIRLENLMEFKSITTSFEERTGSVNLSDFLEEVSLIADMSEHQEVSDVVTLMTIHSAKGLEFDCVFLVGMEEGIFPHSNSFLESDGLEEERRLCYVGITRAKKRLFLSNAKRRLLYGKETVNLPSRFITEIDKELLDIHNLAMEEQPKINKEKFYSTENEEYTPGNVVMHMIYGRGVVVDVSSDFVSVAFSKNYGVKKLLKNHKSLQKVG